MFVTPVKPDLSQSVRHLVRLGSHQIEFDKQLTVTVEDISNLLDPLLQGIWGRQMYRIVLTVNSQEIHNKIKYTIR